MAGKGAAPQAVAERVTCCPRLRAWNRAAATQRNATPPPHHPAQLIPEEFEHDNLADNSWISSDQTTRIQTGSYVRVRIVGIKWDPSEVVSARPCPAPPPKYTFAC